MKKKNPAAVALGQLAAKRFEGIGKNERSDYMKAVRRGEKVNKTRPFEAVDK